MIGFAAYSLGFSPRKTNAYFRESDRIRVQATAEDGLIYIDIDQDADYKIEVSMFRNP